jgi:hypothetical protein
MSTCKSTRWEAIREAFQYAMLRPGLGWRVDCPQRSPRDEHFSRGRTVLAIFVVLPHGYD